jgi:hypothetical protein
VSDVRAATVEAIAAAAHLGPMDAGAVEALLVLAATLDDPPAGKFDNVTLPTYLKYCESLGLTPAGRARLEEKKPEETGGKLGKLRDAAKKPAA